MRMAAPGMRRLVEQQLRAVTWMCSSMHGRMAAPGIVALGQLHCFIRVVILVFLQQNPVLIGLRRMGVRRIMSKMMSTVTATITATITVTITVTITATITVTITARITALV